LVRSLMTEDLRQPEPGRFRVLVTSAGFEPGFRGGGPIRSVADIVDTVSDQTDLYLVTRDRDLGSARPYPGRSGRWMRRGRSQIFYLNTHRPGQWLHLWWRLRRVQFDILYVNSLWNPIFTVVPVGAARLNLIQVVKVILAPRGELSPGALSLKTRKKLLFLKWWAPLLRSINVVWHASSETEAAEIMAIFPLAHIRVNRPQVSLPDEPLPPTDVIAGPARFVFIGRISPMKNLDLTLIALRSVSEPAAFDIYGPLEDANYWSKCRSLIGQLPPHVRVTYRGELFPSDVRRTFSRYDAFVVPTLGENFGHAIAESLSASCPVFCSDLTPWTEVLVGGGGIVVRPLTSEELGKELERFASLTPAERLRARQAAGSAYRLWRHSMSGPNILEEVRVIDRT
jgi:glycosyltransferase involved in cell wall biosynthesis